MTTIVSLTAKIVVLLLFGALACKLGILTKEGRNTLSELLVSIILPVSMLASSQQEFDKTLLAQLGKIAGITLIYYILMFLFGFLLCRIRRVNRENRAIYVLLVTFANTAFLGIPILTELLGPTGTLYAVIFNTVFDLVYFSIGMYFLETSHKEQAKGFDLQVFLKNPMVWISIITIVLYVLPYRFPPIVVDGMETLGNTMMPVSMLIIGAQISEMDFKKIFTNKIVYVLTLLRLVLIPLISFFAMKAIGASHEVLTTIVILNAMPSASLNVIMAEKYHTSQEVAAATVMQTTIMMLATLPVFFWLC